MLIGTAQRIVIGLLVAAQLLAGAGLASGMVLCLGASGHIALEDPGHQPGCDHGCPEDQPASDGDTGPCEERHGCADVAVTAQLIHRLPADADALLPPDLGVLAGMLPLESRACTGEHLAIAFDGVARIAVPPAIESIRTTILRL